jgi:hypothetical protein
MKRVEISDHAMLRYLERTGRIDMEALKKEILTPDLVSAVKLGANSFKVNGHTWLMENGRVVTFLDNTKRGYRPR